MFYCLFFTRIEIFVLTVADVCKNSLEKPFSGFIIHKYDSWEVDCWKMDLLFD